VEAQTLELHGCGFLLSDLQSAPGNTCALKIRFVLKQERVCLNVRCHCLLVFSRGLVSLLRLLARALDIRFPEPAAVQSGSQSCIREGLLQL
jgi:hypothetical protein